MNRDGGWKAMAAVAQAIRRVRQRIPRDQAWQRRIDAISAQCQQ
jgi:hypothetical protein